MSHDPLAAALEIREQLASEERRLLFLCGAGTSMAAGIPGIADLTASVETDLPEILRRQFVAVKRELDPGANVQEILDRVRLFRELMEGKTDLQPAGIGGKEQARTLDQAICRAISKIVSEPKKEKKSHEMLARWIGALHLLRRHPLEVFTTNYDLLFEQALEDAAVPFFDGFVGSSRAFFSPDSVQAEEDKEGLAVYPPRGWTRIWKLHGSLNWRVTPTPGSGVSRIVRVSDSDADPGGELIIFPSREKYSESRKLPFVAFHDRLRGLLSRGECLLVVLGYSFSDQHLNETLFNALRTNPHLALMALCYGEGTPPGLELPKKLIEIWEAHRNVAVYGPDKACIGGLTAGWGEPTEKRSDLTFWDPSAMRFTLGQFDSFAAFLQSFIGVSSPQPPHKEAPTAHKEPGPGS